MHKKNKAAAILAGVGAALLLATGAQAANSVHAARVGATDPAALAEFYEAVYGLQEVNRMTIPSGLEIMLAFGDSVADAKSDPGVEVFINKRPTNDNNDPIAHVIINVDDMAATVKAVKAHGGSMQTKPFNFQNVVIVGIARDPAGNLVEMLQTLQGGR